MLGSMTMDPFIAPNMLMGFQDASPSPVGEASTATSLPRLVTRTLRISPEFTRSSRSRHLALNSVAVMTTSPLTRSYVMTGHIEMTGQKVHCASHAPDHRPDLQRLGPQIPRGRLRQPAARRQGRPGG